MAVKVENIDTFCMDGWIRSWYLWCHDDLHKHQKHHYRFDQTPGEFIYHAPCLPHSIHVALTEPLLTIYAWTGQVVMMMAMSVGKQICGDCKKLKVLILIVCLF